MIYGDGAIDIVVELSKLVYITPNFFIFGVENMSTVFMNLNTTDVLGISISRNVAAAVDDQAALSGSVQSVSHNSTVQTGTNDQIIIHPDVPFWQKIGFDKDKHYI